MLYIYEHKSNALTCMICDGAWDLTYEVTPFAWPLRGAAGHRFRFIIWTPISHLMLRKVAAAVSPKPGSRMGFEICSAHRFR